jgi:hypothetical protein
MPGRSLGPPGQDQIWSEDMVLHVCAGQMLSFGINLHTMNPHVLHKTTYLLHTTMQTQKTPLDII